MAQRGLGNIYLRSPLISYQKISSLNQENTISMISTLQPRIYMQHRADQFGTDAAAVLNHLVYLSAYNKHNDKNQHGNFSYSYVDGGYEGRREKYLPNLSYWQIRDSIQKLWEAGVIECTAEYNHNKFDKTYQIAVDPKECELELQYYLNSFKGRKAASTPASRPTRPPATQKTPKNPFNPATGSTKKAKNKTHTPQGIKAIEDLAKTFEQPIKKTKNKTYTPQGMKAIGDLAKTFKQPTKEQKDKTLTFIAKARLVFLFYAAKNHGNRMEKMQFDRKRNIAFVKLISKISDDLRKKKNLPEGENPSDSAILITLCNFLNALPEEIKKKERLFNPSFIYSDYVRCKAHQDKYQGHYQMPTKALLEGIRVRRNE